MITPQERIRRLQHGEEITIDGLQIERLPDGEIRYRINIVLEGERIHRVVGYRRDGMNYRQARAVVETLRARAREGRLDMPKGRKLHRTLAEAVPDYLARLEAGEGGSRNIARKRQQLQQHVVPFLGDRRLPALTKGDFERYRKHRRMAGASDATINREAMAVSHLLTCAVEWKWLGSRPCKVPLAKEAAPAIVVFDDATCDALIRAALDDPNPYAYLFVAFGLNTGMRHAEILASRYDRIDFSRRRLEIPEAKAGRRTQPLTESLSAMLLRERAMAKDPGGWIFPAQRPELDVTHGGHMTRMDRPFARTASALGLEATPHTMRHTAVSRLIAAGTPIPLVMSICGHKTVAMVLRYTHVSDPEIDKAMQILDRGLPQTYPNPTPGGPDADAASGAAAKIVAFPKR